MLTNADRRNRYAATQPGRPLTGKQQRRIRKKAARDVKAAYADYAVRHYAELETEPSA